MPHSIAAARDATRRRRLRALTACAALSVLLVSACGAAGPKAPLPPENPPAAEFDLAGSDARALELADACMRALGGRRAWDETRYLAWRSFGARLHVWDKHSGDLRIEAIDRTSGEATLTLMNVTTRAGRAWRGGRELAQAELASALEAGHASFAYDSDWMFLPYKLKDAGVTLRYEGLRPFGQHGECDVLSWRLRTGESGAEQRYELALDPRTRLVRAWAFYARPTDEQPLFVTPWSDWRRYGRILLSADRGPGRTFSDIGVYERLPESVFTDPAPIALAPYAAR